VALLGVGIQLLHSQNFKDLSQMLQMLVLRRTVHQYVIKINNHKMTNEGTKNLIHQGHECARCIRQPERHHLPFVEAISSFEGGLPFISGSDPDLMIPTPQVNLGKDCCSMQLVNQIIKSRYWKAVLDGNFVNGSAVNAHPPCTVFFWNQ
jgi:hypothetical protein